VSVYRAWCEYDATVCRILDRLGDALHGFHATGEHATDGLLDVSCTHVNPSQCVSEVELEILPASSMNETTCTVELARGGYGAKWHE
jgi:hypothetical protein